jgi:putative ABC transport system ATP-binding protein
MAILLKLQNVYKTYFLGEEQVHAVENVTFDIKQKEYISILGTSGSGKSTLMYLIGLLEQPSAGKIFVEGKDVSRLSDDQLSVIRNHFVGFIFQQFNLISKFTVLENIMMPAKYAKEELDFDPEERALALLKRFNMLDRKDFFPNKISGGQQQRVAIARALLMKPRLILADEPTGNLDSKTGDEILNLLGELNKEERVTIVLVTHDRNLAARTERQVYIRDGKLVDKYT